MQAANIDLRAATRPCSCSLPMSFNCAVTINIQYTEHINLTAQSIKEHINSKFNETGVYHVYLLLLNTQHGLFNSYSLQCAVTINIQYTLMGRAVNIDQYLHADAQQF